MISAACPKVSATSSPCSCSRSHASAALDSAYKFIEPRARHPTGERRTTVSVEAEAGRGTARDRWAPPTSQYLVQLGAQAQGERLGPCPVGRAARVRPPPCRDR